MSALARHAQRDAFVARGVLVGVVEQVDEHRHHRILVGNNRRQVGRHLDVRRMFAPPFLGNCRERVVHDVGGVGWREGEALAVALEARERQEVVDQPRQACVLDRHQLQILPRFLRIGRVIFEQRVDEQTHRRERRLQLVRHGGHEVGLERREPRLTSCRAADGDGCRHDQHDRDRGDREIPVAAAARLAGIRGAVVGRKASLPSPAGPRRSQSRSRCPAGPARSAGRRRSQTKAPSAPAPTC